jgi:branched-chain amino acid transport system substrate-binding protein
VNKKIIVMLMVAALSIGGLASCQKPEAMASYRIGALVSQTGSYAGLGLQSMEGMQLMVDKVNESGGVNGIPLELVISDDKSEATEAVLAARKLIEVDEVHVLVAASQTAISMSLVPVANETEVPTVILSGTTLFDDELGDWTFRPTGQEDSYITLNLEYLSQELGISKYAALIENTSYGQGGKAYLPGRSPDYNLTLAEEQYFDPGATDLTPQLTNIKNSGAEAIFIWGGSPTASMAVKQAREMSIQLPIMGTPPNAAPNMVESFGQYYEMEPSIVISTSKFDIWDQLPDSDPYKADYSDFAQLWNERYDHSPSMWGLLGGQFILFIEDGLKRANITSTNVDEVRSQLRDAFENTSNLRLLTGIYSMSPEDHFGQVEWSMCLITYKDGKAAYLP